MSEQFDPEAKDMLMQLMGQTYGELHKLDSFIVGATNQLQPKSEAFKQTVANVTRSINSNVPQSAQSARVLHAPVHGGVAPAQAVNISPVVAVDPNQLEFGFDNSVTALSIDKALTRIEDKMDRLSKTVNKLMDLINK